MVSNSRLAEALRRGAAAWRGWPGAVCAVAAGAATFVAMGSAGGAQAQGGAPERPAMIAVVDGSGSMWGGLGSDGASKLEAAREALDAVLPRIAITHRPGLATFGPGCRSASVVVAPQDSAEAATTPLVKFNPRGKGPLSAGITAAAEALPDRSEGIIVVLHDGLDNCGADACAAAAQIHADKPGVVIHTISLGMEDAEVAAMACVAKTTGGRAFAARDRDSVARALNDIANLIERPAAAPQPAAAAPEPVTPAAKGPPRLVAAARLTAGGTVVAMPLNWRVLSGDGKKVLHEAVAPSLAVQVPAGATRVEVSSGRIHVAREVTIADEGDTVLDVALEAGIVRFDTGAKRLASDAEEPLIRLESIDAGPAAGGADKTLKATPLWIARGKAVEAMLPPGRYRAVAEYGLAKAMAPVSVSAGTAHNLSLPLEAGRLELSATPEGLEDLIYRIDVDDPERSGGRRELARTAHAAPVFVLSTGTYYVTVSSGREEIRNLVTVRSGEVTRQNFRLDAATLSVSATLNGAPPGRAPLVASIVPLDAGNAAQAVLRQPVSLGRTVRLAPGRYRIALTHGTGGAAMSQEVVLRAGDAQRVSLDVKTAEVVIDLAGRDGALRGALCELKDAAGAVIWRTVEIKPRRTVAPGAYSMRCRAGGIARDIAVTTAAGQVTRVAPFAQ